MKIVYNACFGGFGLSDLAVKAYAKRKGWTLFVENDDKYGFTQYWRVGPDARSGVLEGEAWHRATQAQREESNRLYSELCFSPREIDRTDPDLVAVVEQLGDKANDRFAKLEVAEVPTGERYRIDEYDGNETVMTVNDYDWKIAV